MIGLSEELSQAGDCIAGAALHAKAAASRRLVFARWFAAFLTRLEWSLQTALPHIF